MNEWQDISTAPKDGTVVRLRNNVMGQDEYVLGKWGEMEFMGRTHINWVSEFTPHEFFPFPSGRLVCPDEWSPNV